MKHFIPADSPMHAGTRSFAGHQAQHFSWQCGADGVAVLTLNRPERKNPLTFESYAELRELFTALRDANDVRVVVLQGAGGNFCSGGDVHDIIAPLTRMSMPELLSFTRMTGDLVKAMRLCPQPVIVAIDGVCAGAGAMLALASDLRLGTAQARISYLFSRVGLAGADMGACTLLPRVIGQGRASELLFSGRAMTASEGLAWGFFNQLHEAAKKKGVKTNMGNQGHTGKGIRFLKQWVSEGIVGNVKEIHVWTNRPIWPQGNEAKAKYVNGTVPKIKQTIKGPEGKDIKVDTAEDLFNWENWLAACPSVPFTDGLHPFAWRGHREYGAGAMGDMGCHLLDGPFWACGLGEPYKMEAECQELTDVSWPKSSHQA